MKKGRSAAPVGGLAIFSACGDGTRLDGHGLHRFGLSPRAALPREGDLRLKASGEDGFQPAAFFFHDLRPFVQSLLSFDLETNLTDLWGADLSPIVRDCDIFCAGQPNCGNRVDFIFALNC